MNFLAPIAALIAAGITVPLLVLLYFLKLRRRMMPVSSTLLWKKSIHDLQVNSPFQKLRRNLLLLLQLLILAALLLALARPALRANALSGDRMVLLIDHSASMNATDLAPHRLDRAKRAALDLVNSFEGSGGIMVVSFAQQARVMQTFTTDKALLRNAIQSIPPTDQLSHLGTALALIEPHGLSTGSPDAKLDVHVLSDGRLSDRKPLSLRGGSVTYHVIASTDPARPPRNLAIVALSAQRVDQKPHRVQLFARLANYSPEPVSTTLSLAIDGRVQRVVPISVPARDGANGEVGSIAVPMEFTATGSAVISVSHALADDLATDNAAALVLTPPQKLNVLLVTKGNAFVERALKSAGVRRMMVMPPDRYEQQDLPKLRRGARGPDDGYDLIVFDHYSPKFTPPVNSLYLGGAPPLEGVKLVEPRADAPRMTAVLDWVRDDPLLRYVALDDLRIVDAGRLVLPADATVLAIGQAGPLMARIHDRGVRHVMASFNVLNTRWPIQLSFAVFMANVVETLGQGGSGGAMSFQVGEVATVAASDAMKRVTYTGPAALAAPVELGRAVLPMFDRAGLYTSGPGVVPPLDRLAVNLTDAVESDLSPVTEALAVASVHRSSVVRGLAAQEEVWRYFLWAALAVLMIEWVVYTRRMHL